MCVRRHAHHAHTIGYKQMDAAHLIEKSTVIDIAAQLRKLVLQDLFELQTARLLIRSHARAATAPRSAVCHLHDLLDTGPAIRINLQAFDYVASETRFAHEVRPPQHGGDLGHAGQREAGVENNRLFG